MRANPLSGCSAPDWQGVGAEPLPFFPVNVTVLWLEVLCTVAMAVVAMHLLATCLVRSSSRWTPTWYLVPEAAEAEAALVVRANPLSGCSAPDWQGVEAEPLPIFWRECNGFVAATLVYMSKPPAYAEAVCLIGTPLCARTG